MSFIPLISSQHTVTSEIAKFLNQLLQPFVEKTLESITFRDEIDFMKKLNHYANVQQHLTPKTLFVTIKITNFYTLDTHENMIEIIEQFLESNLTTKKLGDISIINMKKLLKLFLQNNIFSYNNTIYQFTKGSPNTMGLSETLANIYLSIWQKKLSDAVQEKQEFFGRYRIFFKRSLSDQFHPFDFPLF